MSDLARIDARTYRHFIIVQRDLALHGFVLHTRDDYFFVGLDVEHEKWKDWGLVPDNELSGAITTFAGVEAWCDGFLSYLQYAKLAKKVS